MVMAAKRLLLPRQRRRPRYPQNQLVCQLLLLRALTKASSRRSPLGLQARLAQRRSEGVVALWDLMAVDGSVTKASTSYSVFVHVCGELMHPSRICRSGRINFPAEKRQQTPHPTTSPPSWPKFDRSPWMTILLVGITLHRPGPESRLQSHDAHTVLHGCYASTRGATSHTQRYFGV